MVGEGTALYGRITHRALQGAYSVKHTPFYGSIYRFHISKAWVNVCRGGPMTDIFITSYDSKSNELQCHNWSHHAKYIVSLSDWSSFEN